MSEDTPTRARPYPAAMKEEIADLNMKMDSLIKHWADAAEMTVIMEACRDTVQEVHKELYQLLSHVSRQLALLLTPSEEPPRRRGRLVVGSVVGLVSLLLAFWLGGFVPTASRDARRLGAFLADVHTTLEANYSVLPFRIQEQLQGVYREHKYEPLRTAPQEQKR